MPLFTEPTKLKCGHRANEKGVALIVVMLVVALIAVLAVEMSARLQLNVARTINIKANNQAYWYALGAEQFAQSSLATLKTLSADNINLSQAWAKPFEFPVEGGVIKAELIDMQACFNLNSIADIGQNDTTSDQEQDSEANDDTQTNSNTQTSNNAQANNKQSNNKPLVDKDGLTPAQRAFHRLLENFIQDSLVVDTLRDSLIDWIDNDSSPSNYGAEDSDYESLALPYLAANNPLSHVSELRLINGVDQAIQLGSLESMRKLLCVLPESSIKINVNTIPQESAVVLSALLGDTESGADIIQSRPEEGFQDIDDFFALAEVEALELTAQQKQWFDVSTQYFKLNTLTEYQGSRFRLSTTFRLDDGGVRVISREFGGAL